MFSYFQSTWYIYGRSKASDKYTEALQSTLEHHDDLQYHMGRFKHEVFLFALGMNHATLKSLYLYNNYWRIAKCWIVDGKLFLDFRDSDTAALWDSCDEVLTSPQFAWMQRPFSNRYAAVTDDYSSYQRSYLLYKQN